MAIETDTERAIFLATADFGTSATYTPSGGSPASVNILFDNEFVFVSDDNGLGVESTAPAALVLSSDVSGAAHGDTLAVSGTTYNIVGIEPDGQGMTRLMLEAQ